MSLIGIEFFQKVDDLLFPIQWQSYTERSPLLFFADAIVVFTLRVVRYVPLHLS
ncbi:hypothetical protein [Leptospira santarosai]|uniref:hypothetical protein n=1 Tax=Leptospira santarosai TaxID=28183 RepID=UPI0024AF10D9|nr:hypothetical protein [Leptospira santarosai]MBW9232261.1 hypothetical protein [Leptospira santarosai]MDI7192761.1 hypothetical protein [Leptospira santarosai]